jgi:flagellar basal body P-ring formation protein FlgA
MRHALIATAILTAAAANASGATLRPMTTLHAPVVLLSDLFDDAGPNAARVLGPAPAPGARIVVESRQLAAIAQQFRVAWHPAFAGERAVLDRPGRPLAREEMMPPLKAALVSAGAPADADIELAAFDPPMIPADGVPPPSVTQLEYDAGSGRFTALLAVAGAGLEPLSWRVSGRAQPMLEVPVAVARLLPGSVLNASDLRLARFPAARVQPGAARRLEDVVGKQLRYQAAPNVPLMMADVAVPVLVRRDARVLMVLDGPGIALTAEGRALESGAEGEHVRVLNPVSRAVLDAQVVAADRVRIDPNAPPLQSAATKTGFAR